MIKHLQVTFTVLRNVEMMKEIVIHSYISFRLLILYTEWLIFFPIFRSVNSAHSRCPNFLAGEKRESFSASEYHSEEEQSFLTHFFFLLNTEVTFLLLQTELIFHEFIIPVAILKLESYVTNAQTQPGRAVYINNNKVCSPFVLFP